MTAAEPQPTAGDRQAPPAQEAPAEQSGRRPATLAAPVLAAVAAVLLLAGAALMRVPAASGFLGPRFFPLVLGALLLATAIGSGAWALRGARAPNRGARKRERPPGDPAGEEDTPGGADSGDAAASPPRSDWRTLATMAAALAAHVVLLHPLGWLLAGTLLFWGISYALDRRTPVLDLCVAAALAGVVQLVFSGLLGVTLPAGVLGKVL